MKKRPEMNWLGLCFHQKRRTPNPNFTPAEAAQLRALLKDRQLLRMRDEKVRATLKASPRVLQSYLDSRRHVRGLFFATHHLEQPKPEQKAA